MKKSASCKILGIKEPTVPNIPSRTMGCWKNLNKKEKIFFVPNLNIVSLRKKNRTFFMKDNLNMAL